MPLSLFQKITLPFRRVVISDSEIGVRQAGGWHFFPKDEIAAVKAVSVSKIVIRLYDGRRFELSLYRLSMWTYTHVMSALKAALHENRKRRGLWQGAEDLGPV